MLIRISALLDSSMCVACSSFTLGLLIRAWNPLVLHPVDVGQAISGDHSLEHSSLDSSSADALGISGVITEQQHLGGFACATQ